MKKIVTKPNIGKRILAGLMDYGIIFTFTYVFAGTFGEPNIDGGYTVDGLPMLIPIGFWVIMIIGIEQFFGATLGNYLLDLKPISINGVQEELTIIQSFKRHLVDLIDMFFFGLIGIMIIKNTEMNQRLGDLWAKTIVVNMKEYKELNNIKTE